MADAKAIQAKVHSSWASHPFEIAADSPAVGKAIETNLAAAANRGDQPPLSPRQLAAAHEAAQSFLTGYSSDKEEVFLQYRIPVGGYEIPAARSNWMRQTLKSHGKVADSEMPADPKAMFVLCWNKAAWTGKPYFNGIAAETIRFNFSRDLSPPMAADVRSLLPSVPTLGFITFFPYFQFPGQPNIEKLLSAGVAISKSDAAGYIKSNGLAMTMVCIIKPPAPDVPLPVIYKLYWSEQHDRWLPFGLALATSSRRNWDPLF